jgi:predicted RNA-binding protein with PIN domain
LKVIYVDGYNVINIWPDLKKIKNYSFEAARQKLIDSLQNYATFNDCKIYIVFDAQLQEGNLESIERLENIYIVFTKEGETADAFIERETNAVGRKKDVCVVTSDSLEQQVAFQRGAARMSSLEFYYAIKEVEKIINKKVEKKYSDGRNILEERLSKDILEKLEKIRRSH